MVSSAIDIDDRRQAEQRLRQENTALREEIDETSMFKEIVGSSSALRAVLSRIAKVAPFPQREQDSALEWRRLEDRVISDFWNPNWR